MKHLVMLRDNTVINPATEVEVVFLDFLDAGTASPEGLEDARSALRILEGHFGTCEVMEEVRQFLIESVPCDACGASMGQDCHVPCSSRFEG